jgi:hypothetical protein
MGPCIPIGGCARPVIDIQWKHQRIHTSKLVKKSILRERNKPTKTDRLTGGKIHVYGKGKKYHSKENKH